MKKWVIFYLLLFFCTGCGAALTEENLSKLHFTKAELEMGEKTPQERAMAIKRRLQQVEGVIGTGVVVEGHTAIIGLRLETGVEQTAISRVKQEADAKAREADAFIENTSITTNVYIVSLIEEMEHRRAE